MNADTLWTVPHLPADMDSLWTAKDKWTSRDSCPQPAHTCLGQVIEWTSDLTTAAWITARLNDAVTHTDHSENGGEILLISGDRKKEVEWTKSEIQTQEGLPQINPDKFQLTSEAEHKEAGHAG